ncbi:MAG: zinc-ribbon domain-containing protein, partial [Candidatus Heimdallarchaeota archaeon]
PQFAKPSKAPKKPKDAKYCPTCGSANELASTYCSSCGTDIQNI